MMANSISQAVHTEVHFVSTSSSLAQKRGVESKQRGQMRIRSLVVACLEPLRASSPVSRLVHGTVWSLAAAIVARGLVLLSGVIVARALGKIEFGRFGIIQSTIAMF